MEDLRAQLKATAILLNEARSEITLLRSQNELMRARLDMFDSVMAVLHTDVARPSQGMAPDLVYTIDKHLNSLDY